MKITAVNVAEEESFEYSGLIRQRREYTRGLTSILGLRVGFRLIGVLCFFLALDYVASDNVLLLGDSIDRYIVQDWCVMKQKLGFNHMMKNWGLTSLQRPDKANVLGTLYCRAEEDIIGFVHIFGSPATGPYLHNLGNNATDKLEDTSARLKHTVTDYIKTFGAPDRIIFHTSTWDANKYKSEHNKDANKYKSEHNKDANKYKSEHNKDGNKNKNEHNTTQEADTVAAGYEFRKNVMKRIDEIVKMVGRSVDVGLRTAVWNQKGGKLLRDFNRITREIAEDKKLTLYDFDRDVWSTVLKNNDQHHKIDKYEKDDLKHKRVFRDDTHPKVIHTIRAGEKMLGRQYSSAITFKNGNKTNAFYSERFDSMQKLSTVYLWHDKALNTNFYVNNANHSRHAHADKIFISIMKLGPYDIRHFTGTSLYKKTALGLPVPPFVDRTIFNKTKSQEFMHYYNGKLRIISKDIVKAIKTPVDKIVQLKGDDYFWLSALQLDAPVLTVYSRTDDYLIKQKGQTEVYYVRDGERIFVQSAEIMTALNKSEIIVIPNDQDIGFLPLSYKEFRKTRLPQLA